MEKLPATPQTLTTGFKGSSEQDMDITKTMVKFRKIVAEEEIKEISKGIER